MADREDVAFINLEAMRAFSKCTDIHCQLHHRFQLTARKQNQTNSFPSMEKQHKNEKRKIVSNDTSMKIEHRYGHLKLSFFTLGDMHKKTYAPYPEQGLPANAHYLILVQDSQRHRDLPINYLKQAYGITPAEGELIVHLINGSSLLAATKNPVTFTTPVITTDAIADGRIRALIVSAATILDQHSYFYCVISSNGVQNRVKFTANLFPTVG